MVRTAAGVTGGSRPSRTRVVIVGPTAFGNARLIECGEGAWECSRHGVGVWPELNVEYLLRAFPTCYVQTGLSSTAFRSLFDHGSVIVLCGVYCTPPPPRPTQPYSLLRQPTTVRSDINLCVAARIAQSVRLVAWQYKSHEKMIPRTVVPVLPAVALPSGSQPRRLAEP